MGAIGIIIKNGIALSSKVRLPRFDPFEVQSHLLSRMLRKAQFTDFGMNYDFEDILHSPDKLQLFRENVPIHTYEKIFSEWWQVALTGEENVTWPGKVENWALSSGTSSGGSKYIPVTKNMLRAIQRASAFQISALGKCGLSQGFYEKGLLMLGGSTSLEYNGIHHEGDLSGITTGNLPFWFKPYSKPGKRITDIRNWHEKLDIMTKEAHKWDISGIAGNPAWFQILLEKIIEHNKVSNIHEVWPNLEVFTHGAVAFDPYKKSFESLLGHPLVYLETYLASEGFIAYQDRPLAKGMKMIIRNGIYYEFVPFREPNIDVDGNILPNAQVLSFADVVENEDYALLISTVAGAWRYVIGDVIRFNNLANREIKIVGRTKHYLSLVGEHLSVENMNRAVEMMSQELNINVKEFTVAGVKYDNRFAHHWFMSIDGDVSNSEIIRQKIDNNLKLLNDDYRVEREHGLKNVFLNIIPNQLFVDYLTENGKVSAQVKVPRVMKNSNLENWKKFIERQTEIRLILP